ncbi:MAG: hypothetical protein JW896_13875 [Deltaproteobacteria bacterium]|nr:hypothetical protein [Deltaproteobacteria bacterium]
MIRVVLRSMRLTLIWLLLIQGIGCGTMGSLYNRVMPRDEDELKKRVWVIPFLDQAGVGDKKMEQIAADLEGLLEKTGRFLVIKGMKTTPSSHIILTPESIFLINPELIKSVDEMGIDIMIVGALVPFETESKKEGIWPFRKAKKIVDISMLVNAVDVINGGFLFSHLETVESETSSSSEGEERKTTLKRTTLDEALSEILEKQAELITEKLRVHPWRSRVLSTDAGALIVDGGRDIGLENGSIFEVYGIEGSIQSSDGRDLPLLGEKVGEIEVVNVLDSSAEAAPLSGGPFEVGQVVQLKR